MRMGIGRVGVHVSLDDVSRVVKPFAVEKPQYRLGADHGSYDNLPQHFR